MRNIRKYIKKINHLYNEDELKFQGQKMNTKMFWIVQKIKNLAPLLSDIPANSHEAEPQKK